MSAGPRDQGEPGSRAWSRPAGALAGGLSALVALPVAELLALVLPGRTSIVAGFANLVIDLTPPPIREWLISLVGTADKPLLTAGIVLGVLAGGAVVGVLARNRARTAWPAYVLLAVVVAVVLASSVSVFIWELAAALGAALAGWAVLVVLLRTRVTVAAGADGELEPVLVPVLSRRAFLVTSAAIGVVAASGGAAFALARQQALSTVQLARDRLRLPVPAKAAPPGPAGAAVDVPGMAGPVTSNADFYRIDTALVPPAVNADTWTLTVSGRVTNPVTLTYADLAAMPQAQQYVTLACVSNPVSGDLVGNALWQGVPLRTVLERAGIGAGAQQLVAESVDGFTAAFPLELALDGREPLIAVGMNGTPLPVEHGFPARLIVPGLYGYVSATKWLRELRLTTFAEESGFWIDRGWTADGQIQAASRIDVPRDGATLAAGPVVVAGRAWHQDVAIGAVAVSVDSGPWHQAVLADSMGIECWRLWSLTWVAAAGEHTLRVRMVDANGAVQSEQVREPGPGPSSGYDSITVEVR